MPSPRWATTTIVLWAAPFLVAAPTGSRDVYSYACQGHLFRYGLNPYRVEVATLPWPTREARACIEFPPRCRGVIITP